MSSFTRQTEAEKVEKQKKKPLDASNAQTEHLSLFISFLYVIRQVLISTNHLMANIETSEYQSMTS